MSLSKIKLAVITASKANTDSTLVMFADLHCFAPIEAVKFVDVVHGLSALPEDNPCPALLGKISEMEKKYSLDLDSVIIDQQKLDIAKMQKEIDKMNERLSTLALNKKNKEKDIANFDEAIKQVKTLIGLNIPLEDVFSCDYVYARFGRLPNDSVEKLEFYHDKPFIFKSFAEDKNYSWGMYFTSKEFEREVDNIFSSLFFERFYIPDFVHGTPRQAVKTLTDKKAKTMEELKKVEQKLSDTVSEVSGGLSGIKRELLFLNRVNIAKKYVVVLGEKISISGFVRAGDVDTLSESIKRNPKIKLEIMAADSDARFTPPKKLKQEDFY